ncbi:MAG: molybdenum cofactor guanylyltransferase [Nitrospira sp.]|jgi:molybdopterin-guanine dinucleotide biosynthesis protein A|nr:molybdenum cofactor guanylyltransferase [Nitrospira sp. BO4]
MISDVTGVLLAGGKSKRMGEDKRFLLIGGSTLIERSVGVMCALFQQVCVVIAQDGPVPSVRVPVVRDLVPNCGSLGGLYTGLRQSTDQHIFVAACDMPFLCSSLVQYMVALKEEADVVMALWKDRLQPTHAVYSRRCLPILEDMIRRHEVKIQHVAAHPALRVRMVMEAEVSRIDHDGRSFRNINTPSDLEAARSLYESSSGS